MTDRKRGPNWLGQVVLDLMTERRISAYMLEQRTGISRNSIVGFLDGKRQTSLPTIERILAELGHELEIVEKK